ncbi:hypothetical protein [Bdellovibrio reynosensis]|uniref:VCBS repeat-containing protein n=1 Tax=Bdellovibrio reynosensis TaxID=2835041 RepID=A0ABY4C5X3_9BACT|nr:hypothetical protein [Bdellovibrio reynosensis]UOF00285.1 hypothetical protein MNR06_11290 [Bdellovibrio reynosensis]
MTSADSAFKKKELIFLSVLALVAMTLITVAVIPSLKNSVKEALIPDKRTVLAKVSGKLSAEGPKLVILKIRTQDTINLEVYTLEDDGSMNLLTKLPLYSTRDGYFHLQGSATNLAVTDVDKDGTLEIVAPTYDEQMVPRLNIFRFNEESRSFDRATAPEGFEH